MFLFKLQHQIWRCILYIRSPVLQGTSTKFLKIATFPIEKIDSMSRKKSEKEIAFDWMIIIGFLKLIRKCGSSGARVLHLNIDRAEKCRPTVSELKRVLKTWIYRYNIVMDCY